MTRERIEQTNAGFRGCGAAGAATGGAQAVLPDPDPRPNADTPLQRLGVTAQFYFPDGHQPELRSAAFDVLMDAYGLAPDEFHRWMGTSDHRPPHIRDTFLAHARQTLAPLIDQTDELMSVVLLQRAPAALASGGNAAGRRTAQILAWVKPFRRLNTARAESPTGRRYMTTALRWATPLRLWRSRRSSRSRSMRRMVARRPSAEHACR